MFVRAAYFMGRPHPGKEAALEKGLRDTLPLFAGLPGLQRVELHWPREVEAGAPQGLHAVLQQLFDDEAAMAESMKSPERARLRAHLGEHVIPLLDGTVAHINHFVHSL